MWSSVEHLHPERQTWYLFWQTSTPCSEKAFFDNPFFEGIFWLDDAEVNILLWLLVVRVNSMCACREEKNNSFTGCPHTDVYTDTPRWENELLTSLCGHYVVCRNAWSKTRTSFWCGCTKPSRECSNASPIGASQQSMNIWNNTKSRP